MATNHHLYIGTIGEGIWRSSDGGRSFTRLGDGLFVECHVRALTVHARDAGTLYLGCELGLFRTSNGGDLWERVESPLNGKQIWSILVLPSNPNVLLAGTCPSQLFRSEDSGKTWHEPSVSFVKECSRIYWTRVTTLTADSVDKETVWTGVEIDGPRRSDDGGITWTSCREGLSSQDIHAIAVVPNGKSKRVFASTNNDVNISIDNGGTWRPLGLGKKLPHPYFRGLGQKADDPSMVFLGNGDGPPGTIGAPALSKDGGESWQPASVANPANSTIWNFAVHAADPNLVYCNSVSGEVYRSTDAGCSWEKLPREFGEIRAIAWTPL